MTPILVLEAFGELPGTGPLGVERARERRELENPPSSVTVAGLLHRAFEARAELMAWSNLWNPYEAGLISNGADPSMIGWVYVGLANDADLSGLNPDPLESGTAGWATFSISEGHNAKTVRLSVVLLPLIQCLDDALRHIGAIEISGFQLTCYSAHLGSLVGTPIVSTWRVTGSTFQIRLALMRLLPLTVGFLGSKTQQR